MKIDFKTLLIGLLLGICVPLSMGQRAAEPAQKLDADYRYQISATSFIENGSTVESVFVLDHETKRVYRLQAPQVGGVQDIKRQLNGR